MTPEDLREEINIQLELMETSVNELISLLEDLGDREPTMREKAAAAAFLTEFYSGIENIVKRISYYHGVPLH